MTYHHKEHGGTSAQETTIPTERPIPNFYILRPVEGFVLPSADQLVVDARKELNEKMFRVIEVPEPPADLFETLRGFAERGIAGFDHVYYFPQMRLIEGDRFWAEKDRLKPNPNFWELIETGSYPAEVAMLQEGWYIGDRRVRTLGQQIYGEDDYMEPLMAYLRNLGPKNGGIERYNGQKILKWVMEEGVPDYSRSGTSPREIEEVILPAFAQMSGAYGIVENRKYMLHNVRSNLDHPNIRTLEWHGDPVFRGARRLADGKVYPGYVGLGYVHDSPVDARNSIMGFSPVIRFPSKAA